MAICSFSEASLLDNFGRIGAVIVIDPYHLPTIFTSDACVQCMQRAEIPVTHFRFVIYPSSATIYIYLNYIIPIRNGVRSTYWTPAPALSSCTIRMAFLRSFSGNCCTICARLLSGMLPSNWAISVDDSSLQLFRLYT